MALVKVDGFEWYVTAMVASGNEFSNFYGLESFNTNYTSFSGDAHHRWLNVSSYSGYASNSLWTSVPAASEYCVAFHFYQNTYTSKSSQKLITFYAGNSTSKPQVTVRATQCLLEWGMGDYTRVGWLNVNRLVKPFVWHSFVFRVKCHPTAGFIEAYMNGSLYGSVTNINTDSQLTGEISLIRIWEPYNDCSLDNLVIWNSIEDGSMWSGLAGGALVNPIHVRGFAPGVKLPDEPDRSVVFLAKMDGANASQQIADYGVLARRLVPAGAVKNSVIQSKWGGQSVAFDGNSCAYLPTADGFNFGAGALTVESWVWWNALPSLASPQTLFAKSVDAPNREWAIYSDSSTALKVRHGVRGQTPTMYEFPVAALTVNQWVHVLVSRDSSGVWRAFLNGTPSASTYTDAINLDSDPTITQIMVGGLVVNGAVTSGFNGYMDDMRATNGLARATGAFSVPVTAFDTTDANWSKVVMLLNGVGDVNSSVIWDGSDRVSYLSVSGEARLNTSTYWWGASSCIMDGVTGRVQSRIHPGLDMGSRDFTLEIWVQFFQFSAVNTYVPLLAKWGDGIDKSWSWRLTGATTLTFVVTADGTAITTVTATVPVTAIGKWIHGAVVRSGSTIILVWDGQVVGAGAFVGAINPTPSIPIAIGAESGANANRLAGAVSECRLLDGVTGYAGAVGVSIKRPAPFPPPAAGTVPATTAELAKDTTNDATFVGLGWSGKTSYYSLVTTTNVPLASWAVATNARCLAVGCTVRSTPAGVNPNFSQIVLKAGVVKTTLTSGVQDTTFKTWRFLAAVDGGNQPWTADKIQSLIVGVGRI